MKKLALLAVVGMSGCVVQAPPQRVYVQAPPQVAYQQAPSSPTYYQSAPSSPTYYQDDNQPQQEQVISAYIDPPMAQPDPVLVQWAPPPMLVEIPPPQPYETAIWTGGFWVWQGNWIWAHGRWAAPPQFGYAWVHPYYENRGGAVVFVNGFWAAPGVHFIQPPMQLHLTFAAVNAGVIPGPRPIGPQGVFIPAPPGSVRGLIVPAPIGTSPAVVTGAPPIVREGMRVHIENNSNNRNTTNVNNVTIIAPPGSTANGQAVNKLIPAQAHLAAQVTPVVRAMAPEPASNRPIPSYSAGRGSVALPAPQAVRFNNPITPTQPASQPYGQAPQHMPAQSVPSAPQSLGVPAQQRQAMPTAPERYQPQEQNYNSQIQHRPNDLTQPEHINPLTPVQRSANLPNYQEIKPMQNNQVNDMRRREETERSVVPAQRAEPRNMAREQKDEKSKEKEKEHEHDH